MGAGDPRGYYEILGIRRTASAEEVRAAFREHAKRYHPDSTGSAADQARFHRLREAFETLRDPQLRMRYDAEALASEQRRPQPAQRVDFGLDTWLASVRRIRATARAVIARWQEQGGRASVPLAIVSAMLLLSLILLVMVWQRLDRQDRLIAELGRRLQAAPAEQASETGQQRSRFHAAIVFPRGTAEFGPVHGQRIAAAVRALHDAIAGLPDGGWRVVLTARTGRVVDGGSDAAAGWDLTVRRLGAAADYLVEQGVPIDHVAARFHAGPVATDSNPVLPEAIELSLLCCGPAH